MVQMAVDDPTVLDQVWKSKDDSGYTLVMYETRPLDGSTEQIDQLMAKVNSYIDAVRAGKINELYPDAAGKPLSVQLICLDEPENPDVVEVLGLATQLFGKHEIDFSVQVVPREFLGRHDDDANGTGEG
jgi:hypothetical protein